MLDKRSSGLAGLHGFNANNLDSVGTSTVTGSHIAVALGHGSRHGQVAIFAVHVVGSRPEMIKLNNGLLRITRPDTEAWLERVLWVDTLARKELLCPLNWGAQVSLKISSNE